MFANPCMLSGDVKAFFPFTQGKRFCIHEVSALREQATLEHLDKLHNILPLVHQLALHRNILPDTRPRNDWLLENPIMLTRPFRRSALVALRKCKDLDA